MTVRRAVEHVVERRARHGPATPASPRDADVEACSANSFFSFSVGISEHEIGVAAALAESVQRALDLAHAGAHRGQRVGDRLLGIVMGVDAEIFARHMLDDLAHDVLDLVRHGAAIGVAQHDPARTGIVSRLCAGQRVFRVRLVAVEEMLAVDQRLAAFRLRRRNAVADRGEVLLVGGLERDAGRDSPTTSRRSRSHRPWRRAAPARPGSFEAERPGRRVMPNAVKAACDNFGRSAKRIPCRSDWRRDSRPRRNRGRDRRACRR